MSDKKYIESLSNFADALDQLVEEMQNQSKVKEKGVDKPTGKSLNIDDTLISIQEGIDKLKDDNKKILDNQETLLKMSKDSDKSGGLISGVTDDKNKGKIKDGVSTILLISGAVMAIGLAFKVVGGVDFASVIALSLALPLVAYAFVQISTAVAENNLGVSDLLFTSFALITMAGALVISSWIMSSIYPISIPQFLTAVGIGTTLGIVAIGVSFMLDNLSEVKMGDLLNLPLILVSMAGGITLSSWLMSGITPIGIFQFLTAIGVALTLTAISIGVSFMLDNLKDVNMGDILKLPLILVSMAGAIALSSLVLSSTLMIDPSLLLNIVLQGITMGIIAAVLSVPMILFAKLGLKTTHVFQGALNIVLIAGAISISSHLISMGNYSVIPSIDWAVGASASILLFSIPVVALGLLSMTGVGLAAIALGGVMAIMVAGTISIISHILGSGSYDYSDNLWDWTKAASGALMLFSVPILGLGFLSITGIGAIAILAGSAMAISLAYTMTEISSILSSGDFGYGSDLVPWAKGTSDLYTTFTPILTYLGAMGLVSAVVGMFGGPNPFELARKMLVDIAETIVEVSNVLSSGTWADGPTEDWARGVGIAIGAFAPVYSYLQRSGVMSAFFGGEAMKPEEYTETMKNIGYAINEVGQVFAEGKVDKWKGGPTKEWSEGVGGAIGAFAPVFGILQDSKGLFGSGVSITEMKESITTISGAIKETADIFREDNTEYKGGPDKKWSEGVGGAIKVFTELYNWVTDGWDWTPQNIADANKVVFRIAGSILDMSKVFQGYYVKGGKLVKGPTPVWSKYPDSKWTRGVSGALQSFADIYQWADDDNWSMSYINKYYPVIMALSKSILDTSERLSKLNTSSDPSKYVKGLAKSLDQWTKVFDKVEDLNTDEFWKAANSLLKLSVGFNALAESLTNVGESIEGFNPEFIKVMADVSGVDIEVKEKEEKDDSGQALWWDKLLGIVPEKEKETVPTVKTFGKKEDDGMKLEDIHNKLEELNQKLLTIAQNSSNMSEYVDELRSGSQGIEIDM